MKTNTLMTILSFLIISGLVMILLFSSGFSKNKNDTSRDLSPEEIACHRSKALQNATIPPLEKKFININHEKILVEIADNDLARNRGLMFREKLDATHGMLFVFNESEVRHFWMCNTKIPLDIAYFDEDNRLVKIRSMKAGDLNSYTSVYPAKYALEVNVGFFEQKGIKEGDLFKLISN